MLRFSLVCWAIAAGLVALLPATGSSQSAERVVHISVDGLNVAMLQELLDEAPDQMPAFSRLVAEGAYTFNSRTDYDLTLTVPNHTSMITGRPIMQPEGQPDTVHHGMTDNGPGFNDTVHNIGNPALDYIPSVFDVVHDRGLGTGFFASKTRLAAFLDRSYNGTHGALDLLGVDDGRDKIDVYFNDEGDSENAVSEFVEAMDDRPLAYSFVHVVDPDYAGHRSDGWESDEYREAVLTVDVRIKSILDYVSTDADFAGKTAIIITADHGGTGSTHTIEDDPGSYTIPGFVWGPGIPAAVELYSILGNRGDPGEQRLDYNAEVQPYRNGDTGNLALALLGLPPVPGSSLIPELSLAPDPMPGDMNASGTVDRVDLVMFVQHFGMTDGADWSMGDFNGDGSTTLADLAMLQAHFTISATNAPHAATTVPEPTGIALAAIAGLIAVASTRHRKGES
jgi:hypothetical protein